MNGASEVVSLLRAFFAEEAADKKLRTVASSLLKTADG
jgi:hypothetical protein